MKISFIIPTYNEGKCIESCLRSLKKQDVKKEIIVVDSNSKDKTISIAKKYADKVIVTKKRGVGLARNMGAKKAKGDILVFVDADMVISKDVSKRLLEKFKDPKMIGICGEAYSRGKFRYRFVYWLVYMITKVFLIFKIPLFPSMFVAYKKKEFNKVKGFMEWRSAEDYDLSFRMKKLGKFDVLSGGMWTSPRRLKGRLWRSCWFHFTNSLHYLLLRKKGSEDYPALR